MVKEKIYVGELIRKFIKDNKLTNGFAIKILNDGGFPVTDTKFSNKIYGERERFDQDELNALNAGFKKAGYTTDFILTD